MKVKNLKGLKNSKISVPIDGVVNVDGDCCVDVSARCAKILVDCAPNDWGYADKAVADEPDLETDNENKSVKSTDGNVIAGIKAMNLQQMADLATEAGYPKEEWEQFNTKTKKAIFAAYLVKKYNETETTEAE